MKISILPSFIAAISMFHVARAEFAIVAGLNQGNAAPNGETCTADDAVLIQAQIAQVAAYNPSNNRNLRASARELSLYCDRMCNFPFCFVVYSQCVGYGRRMDEAEEFSEEHEPSSTTHERELDSPGCGSRITYLNQRLNTLSKTVTPGCWTLLNLPRIYTCYNIADSSTGSSSNRQYGTNNGYSGGSGNGGSPSRGYVSFGNNN